MFSNQNVWKIILIIVIIIIIYFLFFRKPKAVNTEFFKNMNTNYPKNLSDFYVPPTADINDYVIDNMLCHPSCCGSQWPVPFDNLTAAQLQKNLVGQSNEPYVRTNYTCANGPNGVGCPCIPKSAHDNLANRGQKSSTSDELHPSLYMFPETAQQNQQMTFYAEPNQWQDGTPRDSAQDMSNNRLINDMRMQTPEQNISKVMAYGSNANPKTNQLMMAC